MKKYWIFSLAFLACVSCKSYESFVVQEEKTIGKQLDNWHLAAAQANFETYFSLMTEDAVFIGTDPTENWQLAEFKTFAKPFFDQGKAWNFTPLQRNIYLSENGKTAWFDELLDTQMKICRGSGIMKKENNTWKIAHYVLSITIPNDNTDEVVRIKSEFDNKRIQELKASYSK